MAITIKPFRSNTAGAVPTTANLADGEMAVNSADKKVYLRVGSSIVEVANVTNLSDYARLSVDNTWTAKQTFNNGAGLPNDGIFTFGTSGASIRGNAAGLILGASSSGTSLIYLRPNGESVSTGQVTINSSGLVTAPGFSGPLTGNADTATSATTAGSAATLTTARTINGTNFNGSANITTANWGTARTLTIGVTGKSVNGSANVAWSLTEIGAAPATQDFITGLRMDYVSATAVSVSSGAAYIPSSSSILNVPATITKSSLSLAANSWHHLYLYSNGGTPDIEVSSTAPATAAYFGTARTKNGDTSRRYVGSILTGAGGAIYRFSHDGDEISYITNVDVPFRVLAGGTSTTRTSISLAGVIPPTSTYMIGNTINNGDLQLFIDIPEIGNFGVVSRYTCLAGQRTSINAAVPSRTLQYFYALPPTGAGAFVDVWGYKYDR